MVLAVCLIVVSACGGSDGAAKKDISGLSAKAILAKAKAEVGKQPNVSMKGTSSDAGTEISFKLGYSHKDSYGTFTIDGGVATLLRVGGATFLKADKKFWDAETHHHGGAITAILKGRWIKASAGKSNFGDFLTLADRSFIRKLVFAPDDYAEKALVKPVDGVECVQIHVSAGTIYVATESALPIELTSNDNGGGDATFSYDAVRIPAAPDASEVVDESDLAGLATA